MSVVAVTRGHHYVVSAGHELAALAAFEALDQGGNAIDAGVAAILTLQVVYSEQVSVAGVAPMIIHLAETGELVTIAGVGGWPRALDPDAFIERHTGVIPLGVRRTVVPAALDACLQALARWGTMTFRDVAARAVRYASGGFARHPVMLDYVRRYADDMRHWPDNVAIWMPGGEVPASGDQLVQADLGSVLRFLCDEERAAGGNRKAGLEAVRRAFYRGDIASRILAHQRSHDGLLAAEDLESFHCQVAPTLSRRFRLRGEEVEVHTCGAWCQGPFLLEALSIALAAGVADMEYDSDAYLHAIAETLKLTFADREGYLGDPDFVDVPLDTLIGEAYTAARHKAIDPRHASPGMPLPGGIPGHAPFVPAFGTSEAPLQPPPDTSIVCVIDGQGNGFCSTPSDTSWDTPVVPGTGFAVSARGAQSWAVRGHPSCLAPGKRPRLTPSPCFVLSPGRWIMPFGTPGGDVQIQANLQSLLNHLAFGMPIQDAVEAPRLVTHSHPDSFTPHLAYPGLLTIEGRIDEATCDRLDARGHRIERLPDWTHWTGGVCAVRKDLETGEIEAAADPRRWSRAMGW
ncbi:MAG: gamma-glutamyltransferase [Alphaproteobacteria bacterium]|nr:gamma-glutamyltransferase [Alphaproteobacteria bacterium]